MNKSHKNIFSLMFGSIFTDRQMRRIGIFNIAGVVLIFAGSQLGQAFGFGLTSPLFYITLVGCGLMLTTFNLMMFRTGFYKPLVLRRGVRNKNSEQYPIYRSVSDNWNPNSANNFYGLVNSGIDKDVAIRWASVPNINGIDHDGIMIYIPKLIERSVSPLRFQEIYESGITDFELAANFAEHEIDPTVAKAMMEGSATF